MQQDTSQGRHVSTESPDEMSSAVIEMMRKARAPGVSLVVVNHESVIFSASYGLADIERSRPAVASTSFLWFSMSKLVTATAAMRLADEGALDLAAPIDEYVEYLRAPGVVQPTMQQLLTHTAGLTNPLPVRWVHLPDRPHGPRTSCCVASWPAACIGGPSAVSPGIRTSAISRRVKSWPRRPGNDSRHSFAGSCSTQSGCATPSSPNPPGPTWPRATSQLPSVATPVLRAVLPGDLVGARHGSLVAMKPFYVDGPAYGGLVGTAIDAGRFLRMHLNDGELDGVRVLRPETARSMRAVIHPGKPFDHGIGWFRRPTSSPERWVEHFGSGVGYWNVMRLYPDRGLGVVIMSNGTRTLDFEPVITHLVNSL